MANKYVIRFSKTGYVKYTSHLDLLRMFKRAFKKRSWDSLILRVSIRIRRWVSRSRFLLVTRDETS